jgi:thiol-disulfide isomerase/thioredoxin
MKHFLLASAALLTLFCACTTQSQPNAYTVEGELNDTLFNGQKIYIMRFDDRKLIDSTLVEGNKFTFTGKVDTASLCRIDITQEVFGIFILENGTIRVNLEDYDQPSGTPMNEALAKIAAEEDSTFTFYSQKRKEFKQQYPDKEEYRKQWSAYENTLYQSWEQRCRELYKGHNNDAVGFFLLYTNFMRGLDSEVQEAIINEFGPLLKSTRMVQETLKLIAGQKNTAEGKPFVDVKGKDAEGKEVALSDFVGKGDYVLMDMWASWCGPCRGEIPNLAQLYNRYKGKGFTVVGLFVWDEESNLKKSLEEEKITWPQVIDTEGNAMDLYGVSGIPQIILFAPDGTIVKRNLRGENMIQTVDKIMSNK